MDWTRACWRGRVDEVIGDLERWLEGQSAIEEKTPETDARRIVGGILTYLRNNRSRMDYPSYRMAGLPISSALMEGKLRPHFRFWIWIIVGNPSDLLQT